MGVQKVPPKPQVIAEPRNEKLAEATRYPDLSPAHEAHPAQRFSEAFSSDGGVHADQVQIDLAPGRPSRWGAVNGGGVRRPGSVWPPPNGSRRFRV